MTTGAAKLYTPEVLALATGLAEWPLEPSAAHHGKARSQSCGSTLSLSLTLGKTGLIERIGVAAQACAVGQASAAIFAAHAAGQSRAQIAAAQDAMLGWLSGQDPMPDWPGLSAIAKARDYPARHGAILLPWRAALDALPESESAG